jgi:hypothetical protein
LNGIASYLKRTLMLLDRRRFLSGSGAGALLIACQ